jgi:hypothetical protein
MKVLRYPTILFPKWIRLERLLHLESVPYFLGYATNVTLNNVTLLMGFRYVYHLLTFHNSGTEQEREISQSYKYLNTQKLTNTCKYVHVTNQQSFKTSEFLEI